jgi:DNA-binding response OmpR family regulator
MKVLIITKDSILSRALFLEISFYGAQVTTADHISADTENEIASSDFTVLDADIFARIKDDLPALERTQVLLFGYPNELDRVRNKITAGYRIFTRPFLMSAFLSSFFEKSDEADFGIRLAKKRKSAADSLILNENTHTVSYKKETIELTKREFALLMLLIRNKGETVTRAQAAQAVWEKDGADTNIVDVYIRYLREKLDEKFGIKLITTVRGIGYTIKTT